VAWARTHCFSNEIRVGSSRSIISFHVNWKVWITEIKAWMYLSGHQYSCLDIFKFPLDLIIGRGHMTCPLPTIACWRGKLSLRGAEYWSGLEGRNLYRDLRLLFYFYRKGLIAVWYYNLRNPVKATSLGTQGILRPTSVQSFQHLPARRLEDADPL
jgi:hypothetical protein